MGMAPCAARREHHISAVSTIGTTNPQQAVIDLSSAYAAQGVSVSIVGNQIVVQSTATSVSSVGADTSNGS